MLTSTQILFRGLREGSIASAMLLVWSTKTKGLFCISRWFKMSRGVGCWHLVVVVLVICPLFKSSVLFFILKVTS